MAQHQRTKPPPPRRDLFGAGPFGEDYDYLDPAAPIPRYLRDEDAVDLADADHDPRRRGPDAGRRRPSRSGPRPPPLSRFRLGDDDGNRGRDSDDDGPRGRQRPSMHPRRVSRSVDDEGARTRRRRERSHAPLDPPDWPDRTRHRSEQRGSRRIGDPWGFGDDDDFGLDRDRGDRDRGRDRRRSSWLPDEAADRRPDNEEDEDEKNMRPRRHRHSRPEEPLAEAAVAAAAADDMDRRRRHHRRHGDEDLPDDHDRSRPSRHDRDRPGDARRGLDYADDEDDRRGHRRRRDSEAYDDRRRRPRAEDLDDDDNNDGRSRRHSRRHADHDDRDHGYYDGDPDRAPPRRRHRRSRSEEQRYDRDAAKSGPAPADSGGDHKSRLLNSVLWGAAFQAGLGAAMDMRSKPGPWLGEKGARVAGAAVTSGLVDTFFHVKQPSHKGGVRHQAVKMGVNEALGMAAGRAAASRGKGAV